MTEYLRKKLVYLKRKPQIIPLVFITLACVVFTFKLSVHSNTVMRLSSKSRAALCMFIVTLAAIMAIISYLGFKKYNKAACIPLIIVTALLILQVVLQIRYLNTVDAEMGLIAHNEDILQEIQKSVSATRTHIVFLILSLLSIALLPIYSKLLKKINTTPKQQIEQAAIPVIDGAVDLEDAPDE